MVLTTTKSRTTAKITSYQSQTVVASNIRYFQVAMDNTSPEGTLASSMMSNAFKKSVGLFRSVQDPAAMLETYRSSTAPGREEEHKQLYVKINTEEAITCLVTPFFVGKKSLEDPKAKILTRAIRAQVDMSYSICVLRQNPDFDDDSVSLVSKRLSILPRRVCLNKQIRDAAGDMTTARAESLSKKRKAKSQTATSEDTQPMKEVKGPEKERYLTPSRSKTPEVYRGMGEINKRTGKPKQKRGRKAGSYVRSDGTVIHPTGSVRPTPVKVRSGSESCHGTPESSDVLKDALVLELQRKLAGLQVEIDSLRESIKKAITDHDEDIRRIKEKEAEYRSDIKLAKKTSQIYFAIAKTVAPYLQDNESGDNEVTPFKSCRCDDMN